MATARCAIGSRWRTCKRSRGRASDMCTNGTQAVALISVLGLAALCGCSQEPAEKEPVGTVQPAPGRQTTIQEVITTEAILFPLQQAAITPKVNAPVRQFYVNRGSKVRRGQLLAVLEDRDLR